MIKVNIVTLEATREALPADLRGLSSQTLNDLQSELNPVPGHLQDLEWWPEEEVVATHNPDTHAVIGETLTANPATKTVSVVYIVEESVVIPSFIISMGPEDFFGLFTATEYNAANTSTIIEVQHNLDQLKVSATINVTDPRVIAGVQGLEALGIIASGRATEILQGKEV